MSAKQQEEEMDVNRTDSRCDEQTPGQWSHNSPLCPDTVGFEQLRNCEARRQDQREGVWHKLHARAFAQEQANAALQSFMRAQLTTQIMLTHSPITNHTCTHIQLNKKKKPHITTTMPEKVPLVLISFTQEMAIHARMRSKDVVVDT